MSRESKKEQEEGGGVDLESFFEGGEVNLFAEIKTVMEKVDDRTRDVVVCRSEDKGKGKEVGERLGGAPTRENMNVLFGQASKLINKQMGLEGEKGAEEGNGVEEEKEDKTSLKDLTLDRAKTENFMQGVDDMIELSHKAELLTTDAFKFKRRDELQLMQSLLNIFLRVSEFTEQRIELAVRTLEVMLAKPAAFNMDMIKLVEEQLNDGLDKACVISDKIEKLIKTERFSGNRGWGPNMSRASRMLAFFDSISGPPKTKEEEDDEAMKRVGNGGRKLTPDEVARIYEAQENEQEH